jgi:hypothetical protein
MRSSNACRREQTCIVICTPPSYAETLIRNTIDDKLCVDVNAYAFAKPQSVSGEGPVCGEGEVPAASAYNDQRLYDGLIDAFPIRGFVALEGDTGHDHFFGAFPDAKGPSQTCATFLSASEKAAQQWELERRFRIFEANIQ